MGGASENRVRALRLFAPVSGDFRVILTKKLDFIPSEWSESPENHHGEVEHWSSRESGVIEFQDAERRVRGKGLEPSRQRHRNLNPARLPIPPPGRDSHHHSCCILDMIQKSAVLIQKNPGRSGFRTNT